MWYCVFSLEFCTSAYLILHYTFLSLPLTELELLWGTLLSLHPSSLKSFHTCHGSSLTIYSILDRIDSLSLVNTSHS